MEGPNGVWTLSPPSAGRTALSLPLDDLRERPLDGRPFELVKNISHTAKTSAVRPGRTAQGRHAPDNAWLVRKTISCLIVLGGNKPSEVARARRHHPRAGGSAPRRGPSHRSTKCRSKAPQRARRRHAQSRRSQQSHLGFEVQRYDAPTTACLVRINSNSIRLR